MSVTESTEANENGATSPPPPPAAVTRPASWIDSWFDHLPFGSRWPTTLLARGVEPVRVEHFRDDGDLVIRAEMPGIEDTENIDVSITGDKLTVSAKREQRSETDDEGTFRTEFHYGSFSRTITVPPGTGADDITASYVNGIVEVRVTIDDDAVDTKKIKVDQG